MDTCLPVVRPDTVEAPEQQEGEFYDACIAWTTQQDSDFVEAFDVACRDRRLSLLQITPANLEIVKTDLFEGRTAFRAFFDRASDESRDFLPIVEWARMHDVYRINPVEEARRTWDKAAMHSLLNEAVPVPTTIFIPPYHDAPELPEVDLARLGPTYTIKPAHGGGGAGVVVVATSAEQLPAARQQYPDDMYMLQTRVVPAKIDGQTGWFRIIYAVDKIYPCWWNSDTRVYDPVTVAEEAHYGLSTLRSLTKVISDAVQLHLFSTEIAIDLDGRYIVVDYVNDPIDLRPRSKAPDGVPDKIIGFIAEDLAGSIAVHLKT